MTPIDAERLSILDTIHLKQGEHASFDKGACFIEAAAYLAGEPHSDHPECVCPVIAAFGRAWNDGLPSDEERDRLLRPLLPRIIDTRASTEVEKARSFLALDWLVREFLPTWLENVDALREHARTVRALAPIDSDENAVAASGTVRAAGAAARAAAGAAARDAALAAAWDAAGAAARAAARAAAWDAAWNAARDAALAAAWDAAGGAAGGAAWNAARDAAGGALSPTVKRLQASALDLLERMIEVTPEAMGATTAGDPDGD